MGDSLCPVHSHEVGGDDVVKRSVAHPPEIFDYPAAFLGWELHPFVAFEELDVLQCLIPDAGFVVDMKLPSLLLGVSIGCFPFWEPFPPVPAPLLFRFDLDKHGLGIFAIFHIAEPVVDEEVRGVCIGLAVSINKRNLNRLWYDVQNCQAELLADNEVAFKGGLEGNGMVAAKYINSGHASARWANAPSLFRYRNLVAVILQISGHCRSNYRIIVAANSRNIFEKPHFFVNLVTLISKNDSGNIPRPGEVSLAHNGVLFLDELPEFKRSTLEVLRQPLEDGVVTISRAVTSITYPAQFMLVASMNPCFCGLYGDARRVCSCTPQQIKNYRARISGPLLDRIDIQITVAAVPFRDLSEEAGGSGSEEMRAQVLAARYRQEKRFTRARIFANARMTPRLLKEFCPLGPEARRLLETAVERLGLSARAYSRILKIARTIADLAGEKDLAVAHVAEAIQYRTLDRQFSSDGGVMFIKEVKRKYLI